jgi:hypothetical protein
VFFWGDRWACGVLLQALPERLHDLVEEIEAEPAPVEPGRLLLADELAYLFRGRLNNRDRRQVQKFLAERARHGGAVEGLAATARQLSSGGVSALLVNTPTTLGQQRLWVGAATRQLGASRDELEPAGRCRRTRPYCVP